jgi:FkbM family methyltransferase
MVNGTLIQQNKTARRFFYIDLGCFDGRDIDYFVHFHSAEISRLGKLGIIAFEPDPINFAACKSMQQRSTSVKGTVYDAAVWTENGKVRYAIEKGQKSRIDEDSALYVRSIDFSKWVMDNFRVDDYVYLKFTIEGAEIPILEKMILDESLTLVDHLEIEWNEGLSPDLEPRRAFLECMFDNFGMDFLYMVNPVDLRHAFNLKDTYTSVPKDRTW